MRVSKGFFPTVKEVPADAVIPSHQLMIRAGLMRPLSAGIYSYLPLGYAVVRKVSEIIREEMNAIGAQEFHLPAINPIELWEESGRVQAFGDILFRIKNRPLVLAPTHEEVITAIARNHIRSYRELPQIWYQIQMKFRNEPRAKSGVIRGRQFLMKDSYSLDATPEGLDRSYDLHAQAYRKIYSRCGLNFFVVGASSGAMGGSGSQEFMLESEAGEDTIALCDKCQYAANLEVAASTVPKAGRSGTSKPVEEIHTPNIRTIDELAGFLGIDPTQCAKSLVYIAGGSPLLIFMLGNDQLNEAKLQGVVGADVRPALPEELMALTGADAGSIGPIGLKAKFRIIADKRLEGANGLYSGANRNDYHIGNIDFQRDVAVEGYYDLRTVAGGEPCPNCSAPLRVVTGIEVGHIFKLGTKYSQSLKAMFLDEGGTERPIIMGSYGIGIDRIVACHIEQHRDADGIKWGVALAPYHVHLIAVNANSESVMAAAEALYENLSTTDLDVLYDDRQNVTPGFKFKDADLLGMPLQIIIGEKNLKNGVVELKDRATGKRWTVPVNEAVHAAREFTGI